MCTFSKVHKIFKTALAACHIILPACSSTQCCHKLEKTVVTGLVMVITLGELLFWLTSKARCSQKVCYPLFAHLTEVITSKSFYPLFSWVIPSIIPTHVWFPLSDSVAPIFFKFSLSASWPVHPFACRGQKLNELSVYCS